MASGSQLAAKLLFQWSMIYGVSFPVATLAKSGKMLSVMLGTIVLGKASYTKRQYLQVGLILLGTLVTQLEQSRKRASGASTGLGMMLLFFSLFSDGCTNGLQKKVQRQMEEEGLKLPVFGNMFAMNLFMCVMTTVVTIF
eukprot:NODE_6999_length_593_cov_7.667279_g3241_i1.p2 GENE.NODE_6999_length_593_cov_7.667279_g3241_i1~~NODE_6999_length_593_cov_7.667279_g3241_i1.p2  ORF type:complete len:140 (+),score=32.72 NODE_6999_length_593_cov_7.667279_g3241_i1:2-421(+)